MNVINLGYEYRLVRKDAKNWEMQYWHCAAPNNPKERSDKPSWHGTGNYFQRLDTAIAWVYERALREDDGEDWRVDLHTALHEARDRGRPQGSSERGAGCTWLICRFANPP